MKLKNEIKFHEKTVLRPQVQAEQSGYPNAPMFLEYEQGKMQRTILQSTTSRGIAYYTLLMSSTGDLRLIQIKESEVPKYAGWIQPR